MARNFDARLMILVYGFLLWLTTFIVSVVINPLKEASVPLFDSLIPVALAALTLWFLYLYFKGVPSGYGKAGLIAGVVWLIMNVLLDQLLFSWGPMQMTFIDYMYDIGLTYLLIPVITTGTGYLMDKTRTSSING